MISIFVLLLFVSAMECRIIQNLRASCSWAGHCAGDRCSTYDDCDGSLVCINGKCGNSGSSGGNGQTGTSSGVLYGIT